MMQLQISRLLGVVLVTALGSLFNVIVSRKDWYKGRSRCDNEECKHVLNWYDLIPLFSYLFLRGKCRYCGTEIDKCHMVSELLALAGGVVLVLCGFDFIAVITLLILLFNAIMDYKTKMVQSLVIYSSCAVIIVYRICSNSFTMKDLGVIILTGILLYFLAKILHNYMGAGDFDAMFLIVLANGYSWLFFCLFFASAIGVIYALVMSLNRKAQLPFVPLLFLGYLVVLILNGNGVMQ